MRISLANADWLKEQGKGKQSKTVDRLIGKARGDDLMPPDGGKESTARRIIESQPNRCFKCHTPLSAVDLEDYVCTKCRAVS